jgi:hypothetical protein
MKLILNVVTSAIIGLCAANASAQSLADVAKKTEEDRAKAKAQSKTFTNADLPDTRTSTTEPSVAPASDSLSPGGTAEPITAGVFDGLYRAVKNVQGATQAGVSYVRFSELLQAATSERSIVSDHKLAAGDEALLSIFDTTLADYQASKLFCKMQIDSTSGSWDGVPVSMEGAPNDIERLATKYRIPVASKILSLRATSRRYSSIPNDSFTKIWSFADTTIAKASALYYGKR